MSPLRIRSRTKNPACQGNDPGALKDPYALSAPFYDLLLDHWLSPIHRAVTEFCLEQQLAKVIDLCCGPGGQCRRLHAAGIETTGVDLSAAMVRQARSKSDPLIQILHADATQTPFVAQSFEAAVLNMSVHEKPPGLRQALLLEAARLIRPGHPVLITDYLELRLGLGLAVRSAIERLAGPSHFACYLDYLKEKALPGVLGQLGWSASPLRTFHRRSIGLYVAYPH